MRAPASVALHPRARSPVPQVWDVAASRFWPRAAVVLFFGAVPLVLLLIKERRAMSWRQLAEQIARLPFTD